MDYNISIIVPIFNVENYISQCVESLLEQNLEKIEYIFIDDCSTDKSIEILEEVVKKFSNRINDIKIIRNLENKGISYTRKVGMQVATGNYVIQIDSDDWVECTMCNDLYQKAIENNSDIVAVDYFEDYEGKSNYIKQDYLNYDDHFKAILLSVLHGSLCNKLIRRELYVNNNIYPIESFSLFEDKLISLKLFNVAKKIDYIPRGYLHYRKHNSSFTAQKVKEKHIVDTMTFINELRAFLLEKNLLNKYENEFSSCILYHKKIFLLDEKYFHLWDSFYPEVNKIQYIWGIKSFDMKKKMITFLSLVFGKKIMTIAYAFYRKIRSL